MECRKWKGHFNAHGRPIVGGGRIAARVRYALEYPERDLRGQDVHHTCGDKTCMEVTHLTPIDRNEHKKLHVELRRKEQTHCIHGHEWTEENTAYWTDDFGYKNRYCRECRRIQARNRRAQRSSPGHLQPG